MDFTFGIITGGGADANLHVIIESIRALKIPNYEIIIIGQTSHQGPDIINISFDESQKRAWITRKKNIICQQAQYENIVLFHDYITFDPDWYKGFLEYGNNFMICVTKMETPSRRRFRDYTIFGEHMPPPFCSRSLISYDATPETQALLAPLTYVSGSYYVIKKYIALKFPLNEKLLWCQCEDLEFTVRLRKYNIYPTCNSYSKVILLKEKGHASWESELTTEDMVALTPDIIKTLQVSQCAHINSILSKFL